MDHLLFCVNHPEKIAKRHCKKCDQNVCNECVFDSHIEHHTEITKIEYAIDTKQNHFSQFLSKEIKSIIDKSLEDLKPQIYQLVQKKTEEYIKEHKNLDLKLNLPKDKKTNNQNAHKDPNLHHTNHTTINKKDNKEHTKKGNETVSGNIGQRAKLFDGGKTTEKPKNYDENNPYKKGASKGKGVKDMAKLFEN